MYCGGTWVRPAWARVWTLVGSDATSIFVEFEYRESHGDDDSDFIVCSADCET